MWNVGLTIKRISSKEIRYTYPVVISFLCVDRGDQSLLSSDKQSMVGAKLYLVFNFLSNLELISFVFQLLEAFLEEALV